MKDPERLLEASEDTSLGRDLRALGDRDPAYDVSAGLERFRASLGAAALDPPNPETSGGTPSSSPASSALGTASSKSLVSAGSLWFGGGVIGLAGALLALGALPSPGGSRASASERARPKDAVVSRPTAGETVAAAEASPRSEAPRIPTDPPSPLPTVAAASRPATPKPKKVDLREASSAATPATPVRRSLAEELEELRRLRALVSHAPARVLTEATDGARGAFTPEREALVIEALVRLGRTDEARAKGASFFRRYPQHPEAAKLRRLLPSE